MKNAVLTLAEVLALSEGARVWVEVNEAHCNLLTNEDSGGVHQKMRRNRERPRKHGKVC